MKTRDRAAAAVELFKALGDLNRLRIIRLLASHPEQTFCVGDLADALGVTAPAVSQHIRSLKHVGLLLGNKVGFRVYYYIDAEALKSHKELIDELFDLVFSPCPALEKGPLIS